MKAPGLALLLLALCAQADDGWGTLFTSPAERGGRSQASVAGGANERFDGEVRGPHGVSRWVDGEWRSSPPAGLRPGQRRVDGKVREVYDTDAR
ncbi:hypothetical protein [Jeongeupia chitinilytica]|uniref:Uncharacterized protein n=1 Tax=Jeongeupia chitinilytica TaxID=1041641 RepID=A0ABQ3H2I0_9NEIS|nr:hypothetical protein [Jeongeupia chitinilytica]GHD61723.1 hypothetical protein GCM10007350_16510 [Jeongeupia chitinilytica]